jgi:septum formation protein
VRPRRRECGEEAHHHPAESEYLERKSTCTFYFFYQPMFMNFFNINRLKIVCPVEFWYDYVVSPKSIQIIKVRCDEMQNLILASSSPRRKELLENLHLTFEVSSSDVDESFDPKLTPGEIVMELSMRKAKAVSENYQDSFVIGADTIVVLDDTVLGKPVDKEEAFKMLKALSGKTHAVYSGVSIIYHAKETKFYVKTNVVFWELSDGEIHAYIDTGEPFDKAGAYGIQGFGSMLVKEISGDYFSVVGLPISRTVRELRNLGFAIPY